MSGIQITLAGKIISNIIIVIFTGAGIYYGWVSSRTKGDWFLSNCILRGIMAILFGAMGFVFSLMVDCLIIYFFIK